MKSSREQSRCGCDSCLPSILLTLPIRLTAKSPRLVHGTALHCSPYRSGHCLSTFCRLLSNSPFEALLAVSINLDEASRSGSKHDASQKTSPTEVSSGEYSELDSAVDTAMGSAFAEGVGTSGGGESGDTDYHSDSSGVFQVKLAVL